MPHYAKSVRKLISLAADEIIRDENAVLGQQPAASILKVLERKAIKDMDDFTIILVNMAEKAEQLAKPIEEGAGGSG